MRCHLGQGDEDETAKRNTRVRKNQFSRPSIGGWVTENSAAAIENIQIERARPPSDPEAPACSTLQALQEPQKGCRPDRAPHPDDGIAVSILADKTHGGA